MKNERYHVRLKVDLPDFYGWRSYILNEDEIEQIEKAFPGTETTLFPNTIIEDYNIIYTAAQEVADDDTYSFKLADLHEARRRRARAQTGEGKEGEGK